MSYLTQMLGLAYHNFEFGGRRHRAWLSRWYAASPGRIGHHRQFLGRLHANHALGSAADLPVPRPGPDRQGVVQNLKPYTVAAPLEQPTQTQTIAQGPVASQEAIKMLGTNGGGFFNANSAHPFENPTPLQQLPRDALHLSHPGGA